MWDYGWFLRKGMNRADLDRLTRSNLELDVDPIRRSAENPRSGGHLEQRLVHLEYGRTGLGALQRQGILHLGG